MPSFTRKAIMESFMKLLDARPLNKITIKDIVAGQTGISFDKIKIVEAK